MAKIKRNKANGAWFCGLPKAIVEFKGIKDGTPIKIIPDNKKNRLILEW